MLRFVFASHYKMAEGLKSTIQFLTSTDEKLYDLSAYITQNYDIEKEVKELFKKFDENDTVVIMTDVMAGSVNQKFYPYINEHVHLISGINAPLAMELVLTPEEEITKDYLEDKILSARESLVYINAFSSDDDDDE